ncbi:hypothetical protein P4T04_16525 [Bacillus badius]|uniref:hypothetical protein n=1 Tax=Bacillus badius TaxID=1455 RepID=UPI002E23885F|nr:hypothetical protein [Bacillus badius]
MLSISGASLSAGRAASLLGAKSACGVSPVPLIPPESVRLPFQSTKCTKRDQLYSHICLKIDHPAVIKRLNETSAAFFLFYVKGSYCFPFQSSGVMKPAVDFSFMMAYRMRFS